MGQNMLQQPWGPGSFLRSCLLEPLPARAGYQKGPASISASLLKGDCRQLSALSAFRFVPQPDLQGGIFVGTGQRSDPAGYDLVTTSDQFTPLAAVTNTGLVILPSALAPPVESPAAALSSVDG